MTTPNAPEEVDIAFIHWYNQAQPIQPILKASPSLHTPGQFVEIQRAIRSAFVQGYARGSAAEASRPLPDDPELGPVR